jgi:hypothetical protein
MSVEGLRATLRAGIDLGAKPFHAPQVNEICGAQIVEVATCRVAGNEKLTR